MRQELTEATEERPSLAKAPESSGLIRVHPWLNPAWWIEPAALCLVRLFAAISPVGREKAQEAQGLKLTSGHSCALGPIRGRLGLVGSSR